MAASDGSLKSTDSETLEKKSETLEIEVEETQASTEEPRIQDGQIGGESSTTNAEEDSGKSLEYSSELMDKGLEAMKVRDFAEAAECFSRAVEIRVGHYGELAPECSFAYYKYGCALLYKAQEEADPLGSVPKKENSEKDRPVPEGESTTTSVINDGKHDGDSSHNEGESNDGVGEKDQEDDDEGSEGDDLAEPDEDDSDLDLAWKMLDVARAIAEKKPDDTMEKVDILSALGEVALEREDFETSLSDYLNALSILERLVEPDNRCIAELNFRICLVLEVGSKPDEAIPYCQKAISVCKSRLQRLTGEVKNLTGSEAPMVLPDTNQKVDQALNGSQSDSSVSDKEAEIETLTGLSSDLEKKLEDLQQLVLNPTSSVFSEVMKMVAAKSTGSRNAVGSTALSSSQMGANTSGGGGGGFDSPTVSTAHTNGNSGVTHLGVVGRGVKRVLMSSGSTESSPMKKPSDLAEKGEGSGSL